MDVRQSAGSPLPLLRFQILRQTFDVIGGILIDWATMFENEKADSSELENKRSI
jgi:hypothetical protein